MKNNKLYTTIAVLAIVIIGIIVSLLVINKNSGTINNTDIKSVAVNEEFRLEKGQTANIEDNNVSVKISKFIDSTCPEGAQCITAGEKGVIYELNIDGEKYTVNTISQEALHLAYQIETVSSDYQTFAVIKMVESE